MTIGLANNARQANSNRVQNGDETLGIKAGNRPEMIAARVDGKPDWTEHWFSLTCGPRLMKAGKIWLDPKVEAFKDPNVLGASYRTATGFTADGQKLFIITFLSILTLQQEAEVMQAIGCYEAMNLDGGASLALAQNGKILLPPERNLTNYCHLRWLTSGSSSGQTGLGALSKG